MIRTVEAKNRSAAQSLRDMKQKITQNLSTGKQADAFALMHQFEITAAQTTNVYMFAPTGLDGGPRVALHKAAAGEDRAAHLKVTADRRAAMVVPAHRVDLLAGRVVRVVRVADILVVHRVADIPAVHRGADILVVHRVADILAVHRVAHLRADLAAHRRAAGNVSRR